MDLSELRQDLDNANQTYLDGGVLALADIQALKTRIEEATADISGQFKQIYTDRYTALEANHRDWEARQGVELSELFDKVDQILDKSIYQ